MPDAAAVGPSRKSTKLPILRLQGYGPPMRSRFHTYQIEPSAVLLPREKA
jgi:hypothetical protein